VRYELTDNEWRVPNGIFGSCDLARHGAICRTTSARTPPATIARSAGDGQPVGQAHKR